MAVYLPNIPLLVFLFIAPYKLLIDKVALFSPGVFDLDGIIPTISDSKITPSLICKILFEFVSVISCPNAPNINVFGSIKVNVPIPATASFTYKPVLPSFNFKLV